MATEKKIPEPGKMPGRQTPPPPRVPEHTPLSPDHGSHGEPGYPGDTIPSPLQPPQKPKR